MEFYIDLIIYIFAVIGFIITNIAIFENYIFYTEHKRFFYRKEDIKNRYRIKK